MSKVADGSNLLLGRGEVWFDRFVSGTTTKQGEFFLGNVESLEITGSEDRVEKYSSAEAGSPLLKSVPTKRQMEVGLTMDEFVANNLALAFMGTTADFTQSGSTKTDENLGVVTLDRQYQFLSGRGATGKPITTMSAKKSPSTALVLNTDYTVDLINGTIYLLPTATSIATGDTLLVTYTLPTLVAGDLGTVRAGSGVVEGFLRFIGKPASGPVWEVEMWRVSFSPDGAVALIGDDFGNFKLKGQIQADSVNHPNEPMFRAYRRS